MFWRRPFLGVLSILLISTLSRPPALAADDWWGQDKALHLGLSTLFGAAGYSTLWWLEQPKASEARLALASSLALLPGVAKEIYDSTRPGNHFCGKDLLWDAVGALVGSLMVFGIERLARGNGRAARQLTLRVSGVSTGLSLSF